VLRLVAAFALAKAVFPNTKAVTTHRTPKSQLLFTDLVTLLQPWKLSKVYSFSILALEGLLLIRRFRE
jgi:hypothetical protein